MAQMFRQAVLTDRGAELLTRAQADKAQICFTYMKVGNGCYSETEKKAENLKRMTGLRSVKNVFAFSDKTILDCDSLKLTAVIANCSVEGKSVVDKGYYINEIGLFAKDVSNEGSEEILYSIAVVEAEQGDYMPPYAGNNPVQIVQEYIIHIGAVEKITVNFSGAYAEAESLNRTKEKLTSLEQTIEIVAGGLEANLDKVYQQSTGYTDTKIAGLINGAPSTLDTLGEIAAAMKENENVVDALEAAMGSKAPQAELDGHTGNSTIHITASERTKWNGKMDTTGDASNTVAKFSQASTLANISTGEKISAIMGKASKAIATLISHIGTAASASVSGHVKLGTASGTACEGNDSRLSDSRTPVAHAASGTTYGIGNASKYGHVKLSDTYKSAVTNGAAANGMGASQKALADAYSALNSNLADSLGGITFGVDADGNYGYKKAGADTVIPFKRGGAQLIGMFSGTYPAAGGYKAAYTTYNTYSDSTITLTESDLPSMDVEDYLAVITGYNADHNSNWAGSTSLGTGASVKIAIKDSKTITVKNTGATSINYATDTQYCYFTRTRIEGAVYYIGK